MSADRMMEMGKPLFFVVCLAIASAGAFTMPYPGRPADGPASGEEALALAKRTYAYVVKATGPQKLERLKRELDIDEKWLNDAKDDPVERRNAEREIRSVRRRILFMHPDLQFDRLLAVQRGLPFSQETGMTDAYTGRWSRPGPGLVTITNWKNRPHKELLLGDKLPNGCVFNPDLHWNGDRIVFAFCDHTAKPPCDPRNIRAPRVVSGGNGTRPWIVENDPGNVCFGKDELDAIHLRYFLYEAAADGSWVRQLTGCPGDPMKTWGDRETMLVEDADPCYLPDGGIAFVSTRAQTIARCHGGRYVPSFLLYRADLPAVGIVGPARNIRQLSWGEANEFEPTVMNDGRLCYTRWEYVNRSATRFTGLWTTRPDGTAVAHIYGNYTSNMFTSAESKAIPGSSLLVATASAHHMFSAGSLVLVDAHKGEDGDVPLTRITPECPFTEAMGWKGLGTWCGAMPVNDTIFFASYSPDTMCYPDGHPRAHAFHHTGAWPEPNSYGIWLVDTLGGRELIYQDPEWSTFNPIPMVSRQMPPVLESTLPPEEKAPATGICYVDNVYDCREDLPAGSVVALRVNRLHNQTMVRKSCLSQADIEFLKEPLGTVPVAADGSAAFRIPAEVPLQLQAVGTNGTAIFTMRSFIYSQKGEVQGCTGCHENKMTSRSPAGKAKNRPVSEITPEVDLGYRDISFSYVRSVQPVFDRHCIKCHGLDKESKAPSFIGLAGHAHLVGRNLVNFAKAYLETYASKPYDYFAAKSELLRRIDAGHGGARLTKDERQTLILWMDLNVPEFHIGGGYSFHRPEVRGVNAAGIANLRKAIAARWGEAYANQPDETLVNRAFEERSRVLLAALPVSAGGWGQWPKPFTGTDDPDYRMFLDLVRKSINQHAFHDIAGTCGREDRCLCNSCWVRLGNFNKPKPLNKPKPQE